MMIFSSSSFDVDLEADRAPELVGQAQLLVVAAQHLDVGDLALGQELARAGRRQPLADERLVGRGLDGHPLQRPLPAAAPGTISWVLPSVSSSPSRSTARPTRSPRRKDAVQAAQVAEQEAPVGLAEDLGVLLGDDPVEDLHRVVGVAPDGGDGPELELPTPVVAVRR